MDFLIWADVHAAFVQAVAAVVQALTAVVIVAMTWSLVRSTNAAASTARDQLEEAKRERRESAVPSVQLDGFGVPYAGETNLSGMQLEVSFVNVGRGPALNVRVRPSHEQLTFDFTAGEDRRAFVLMPFGESQQVDFSVSASRFAQGALIRVPITVGVRVEYQDVLGQWWSREFGLLLEQPVEKDGGVPRVRVAVPDESRPATAIENPEIPLTTRSPGPATFFTVGW